MKLLDHLRAGLLRLINRMSRRRAERIDSQWDRWHRP